MKAKRICGLLLTLAMLLGCFSTYSIIALEETSSTNPDDHLVVHYDFLGDSLEEQLRDKAPVGTPNTMTLKNNGHLSKIENGVAYISSAWQNALEIASNADITAVDANGSSSLTIVTRFKYEGDIPSNNVDMIYIPGTANNTHILRWQLLQNGTVNVVPYNNNSSSLLGLGSGVVYTQGQWVDMAITLSYDATTQTLTGSRYASLDGWKSAPHYVENVKKEGVASNILSKIPSIVLGKMGAGMADRGRSLYFDDFRIYNTVLTKDQITALDCKSVDTTALENSLITHYDFNGETQAEQLRDKGTAGHYAENLNLVTTTVDGKDETYIKDGVAYVNQKNGNSLSTTAINDIRNIEESVTLFAEFKANVDVVDKVGEIISIYHLGRIAFDPTSHKIFAGVGYNNTGKAPGSATALPEGYENGWVRVALTLTYDKDAKSATSVLMYSADGGLTWTETAPVVTAETEGGTVDLSSLFSGASQLSLCKLVAGFAERGTSFCYNDVRVYNRALSFEEVKSIETETYSDYRDTLKVHYDFEGSTLEQQLTDKVSGGVMTLGTTGETVSYIANGVAHIDKSQGNYLMVEALPADVMENGEMTIFASFKPTGTVTSNNVINDILNIGNTARLGFYSTTLRPHIRLGQGIDSHHQYSGDAQEVAGLQVYLAAVLRDDGQNGVSCFTYISVDNGVTWKTYGGAGWSDTSLTPGGSKMMLGKLSDGYADNGISFDFDDIQIYSSALTVDEIKASVGAFDQPAVYNTSITPTDDLSLHFDVPAELLNQFDSVSASALFMGEVQDLFYTAVTGLDGASYLRFTFKGITALTMDETVSVSVNATKNGKTWTGLSAEASMVDACMGHIKAADEYKTVCVDILNYGAAAQTYFGYKTEALVNAGLNEQEKAYGTATEPEINSVLNAAFATVEAPTASFTNVALNLRNPVELLFKFKTEEAVSALTAVVASESGTVLKTVSLDGLEAVNGVYCFSYAAAGMRETVTVTIYKDYGAATQAAVSNTLRYSVESYVATMQKVSTDADLIAMLKAMMVWGDSIDALA